VTELRSLVEQEMEHAGEPSLSFNQLRDVKDRRKRNHRVIAGAVGLLIAAVAIRLGTSFLSTSTVPATPQPSVRPQIAGRHNGGLTYISWNDLMIINPGQTQPTVLVNHRVDAFAWSPDGSELAYSDLCTVSVLDMNTGKTTTLNQLRCGHKSTNPFDFQQLQWTPDGTRVLFFRAPYGVVGSPPRWLSYSADGHGAPDELKLDPSSYAPQLSPDGTQVAYEAPVEHKETLFVSAPDGSKARAVGPSGWPSAWSPDGKTLAVVKLFFANTSNYHLEVWLVHPDGSGLMKLAVEPNCCIHFMPSVAWSPDGKTLAVGGIQLMLIDVSTGKVDVVRDARRVDIDFYAAWRPRP
jgi:Tol biopolymer transport system component